MQKHYSTKCLSFSSVLHAIKLREFCILSYHFYVLIDGCLNSSVCLSIIVTYLALFMSVPHVKRAWNIRFSDHKKLVHNFDFIRNSSRFIYVLWDNQTLRTSRRLDACAQLSLPYSFLGFFPVVKSIVIQIQYRFFRFTYLVPPCLSILMLFVLFWGFLPIILDTSKNASGWDKSKEKLRSFSIYYLSCLKSTWHLCCIKGSCHILPYGKLKLHYAVSHDLCTENQNKLGQIRQQRQRKGF